MYVDCQRQINLDCEGKEEFTGRVEEMHKLHEEHREAKLKVREGSDMGDAGETADSGRKRSSPKRKRYGQENWMGRRSTRKRKYCMF